ncbi:MAG: hypothetical protein U5R31_16145 [Acidimicrobiia bacterium]|nr:hypothetical protein [Acidimicrobiia bacterium]
MAEELCAECGRPYCHDCLVYAFGPKKPPLCIACAITAAGIRKGAAKPKSTSRRELRRREKERKRAEKRGRHEKQPVEVKSIDVEQALADEDGPDDGRGLPTEHQPVGTPF